MRAGSVLRKNPKGEQGETLGLLKHLDCPYFGRGDVWENIIPSDVDNLNHDSTAREQEMRWENDYRNVISHFGGKPRGIFVVAGYAPTMCTIGNPKFVTVQSAAVRYYAPPVALIHKLDVPTIWCVTDPRCSPRFQEMTLMWSNTVPHALLSQWHCDRRFNRVVSGKKYACHAVYGACESWGDLPENRCEGNGRAVVLGHSHVKSDIKTGDASVWREVLSTHDGPVYGNGWDWAVDEGYIKKEMYGGVTSDIPGVLAEYSYCPVVSHTKGFRTGKPYVLVANGVVPVLTENYVQLWPGYPREWIWPNLPPYVEAMTWWRERMTPNFDTVDLIVDHLRAGTFQKHTYGGYRG